MEQLILALKEKNTKSGVEVYPKFPQIEFAMIEKLLSNNNLNNSVELINSQTLSAELITVNNEDFPDNTNVIKSIIKIGQTSEELEKLLELSNSITEVQLELLDIEKSSATEYKKKKEELETLKIKQQEISEKLEKGCHYIYMEINKNGSVCIFDSWKDTVFSENDEMRKAFWSDDIWNDQNGKFNFVTCPQQDIGVGHCAIFSLRNCVMMNRLRLGNSQNTSSLEILQKLSPQSYKRKFDGENELDIEWLKIIELCNKTGKHTIGSSITPVATDQDLSSNKTQLI